MIRATPGVLLRCDGCGSVQFVSGESGERLDLDLDVTHICSTGQWTARPHAGESVYGAGTVPAPSITEG